ncbi:hypothetical protein C1H46_022789 [Malus baccata]|uniref:Pectinesterase inhibitor domain-containing protein n=1 Tax=Malus baccata TaxID=106549 RepID=A0A540LYX2_MALBA|nr:hypothetical protein C1H46_022789 [Malus baccata]
MGYGRLQSLDPGGSPSLYVVENPSLLQTATSSSCSNGRSRKNKLILMFLFVVALILASAVSAVVLIVEKSKASNLATSSAIRCKRMQAISNACAKTRFPSLCVNFLLDFPCSNAASEQDLVHISFNMTLQQLSKVFYLSSSLYYRQMDPHSCSAYDDCLELLNDSVDALSRALTSVAPGMGVIKIGINLEKEKLINEYALDCQSMPYSSEYKEEGNHKAGHSDDSSHENQSCKRLRSDPSVERNAEEETDEIMQEGSSMG